MASTIQASSIAPHTLPAFHNPDAQTSVLETPKGTVERTTPRDVIADFNYYKDPGDGSGPAPSIVGKPETYERPSDTRTVTVHDIRGEEQRYSLDGTGFQVWRHASKEKDFVDDDQIKAVYYPEVEEVLKAATGASKVFIFDHTIRRQPIDTRRPANLTPEEADAQKQKAQKLLRGPVQRVHIDQSYKAGPDRVRHHLPAEADRLLAGRYQIINVWRPIRTIFKDPLAVAEANSVPDSDLLPVQLVYPDRVGETFTVRPGDGGHRWFYLNEQRPDEVLLIKCFDSKTDGRARRVPHSAFVDAERVDFDARESIEVRCLVFHPDDTE